MKVLDDVKTSDALLVENMLDMVDVAILTTNYDGIIVDANAIVSEMFGYSHDELIGLSVHVLVPPHLREKHKKHVKKFVNSPLPSLRMGQRSEVTGYRKDGTYFSVEASISKADAVGQKLLVATMIDSTKNRENAERLQWQATHDPLTSLANRKLITERLVNALERSKVNSNNVAVLFIDIDNFKLINDTFGHESGDELLIRVGKLLSKVAGPGDIIGRLGGDEFVIISEKFEETSTITALAESVNESLREPIIFKGQEVYTTASIGVVVGHGNTHFAEDMLRDSDAAMYMTKRHGRDNWNLFTDELHEYAKRELEISNGLRGAGDKGEFYMVFQPIVAAETGVIKGAEALLRWNSSLLGLVSPEEFVRVAEKNGVIIPIGKWIFEEVCKCMASLQKLYEEPPYLSVNVSTVQIDETLFNDFMQIARRYEIDPHNIVLEITETSIMNDTRASLDVLNRFAEKGFEIAVDDFGTGYSSLLQLMKLPITKIKIDKAFIDGVGKRGESQSIVSAIIKMSKTLGKEIIAEGVEYKRQLFELQSLQAEYIQGYYFHKPMDVDALMELLSTQKSSEIERFEGVYRLIYVSRASELFDYGDIPQILREAKIMNAKRGITSFLIHNKNDFAQFIEGPENQVKELFSKIKQDKRFENIEVVFECTAKRRIFNEFSMGFWQTRHAICDENKERFSLWELKDKPKYLYVLFEALSRLK